MEVEPLEELCCRMIQDTCFCESERPNACSFAVQKGLEQGNLRKSSTLHAIAMCKSRVDHLSRDRVLYTTLKFEFI